MLADRSKDRADSNAGGWYLVAVIVLAQLLSYIDRGVLSLFGHSIQATFSLSDSQLGYLYGVSFIIPLAVCSLLIGWAVDRYNRVFIIVSGLLLWSVMTALAGVTATYAGLIIARGGVGLGEATLAPAAYSLIGDRFAPARRGRAVGIVAASVSVGAGSALIVGGLVLGALGPADRLVPILGVLHPWQLTYVLLGISGVPLALLVFTLRDGRRMSSQREQTTLRDVGTYIRTNTTTFLAVFVTGAINVAVGTGVMSWAPTLLLRRFDLPASRAGYYLGIATLIGGVLGPPLATELSDRRIARGESAGRFHNNPYFFLMLLIGVVILALGHSIAICVSGIVLVAGALGGINALSYAAVQDLAPAQIRGRLIALLQFVTLAVGYGLGPSLVAFVTDHIYGSRAMIDKSLVTVAIPLCGAAALHAWTARASYQRTQLIADRAAFTTKAMK